MTPPQDSTAGPEPRSDALPDALPAPAIHGHLAVRTYAAPELDEGSGGTAPGVVVAVSGLDGHGAGWAALADRLAEVGVVADVQAIDLRGRGAAAVAGPFGADAHADDVIAVLERAGWERPVLAGHSFGAHVVAEVARRRPELVGAVVLVDGGTPRRLPDDADRAAVAASVAATIVGKLAADAPISADAVEADAASLFCDESSNEAVFALACPIFVARAGRGVAPGLPAVVPDEAVADLVGRSSAPVADHLDPDADHFSILFAPSAALVDAVRGAVGATVG